MRRGVGSSYDILSFRKRHEGLANLQILYTLGTRHRDNNNAMEKRVNFTCIPAGLHSLARVVRPPKRVKYMAASVLEKKKKGN